MDGGLRERQGRGWWDSGGKRELVKSLLRVVRQLTVQLSKVPEREVYHSLTWLCHPAGVPASPDLLLKLRGCRS